MKNPESTIHSHEEYLKKVDELVDHDRHYYEEFHPVISDFEYDLLVKQVEAYERAHPDLAVSYSPTQRVHEGISKGFTQGQHKVPMLSLTNTYSQKEVEEYIERVYKILETRKVSFCTELKFDGTALSLRYEKGQFVRALTRGNGWVGDDVTTNVKTIKTLPLRLKGHGFPDLLEVRGEVLMHKETFRDLNEQREESGLEPWANPRNAAAGSLKLLDPKEVSRRKLDLVVYAVAEGELSTQSQFEVHSILHQWGLPTSQETYRALCLNVEEIFQFAQKIEEVRPKLPFEIDGIVIKVDDLKTYDTLGMTGKSPRSAIAYKFAPKQAETSIREITIQVGRTGVLTPVAELEPILLAGSTISRATLHNQDEIRRNDFRVGDCVIIEKGGDVIPKVVKVDLSKRLPKSRPWIPPTHCPSCHTAVIQRKGEVAIRCPNLSCPERRIRHIVFFAGKSALDIEHMGEKVVRKLVTHHLISRAADIYLLDKEKLSTLEGFKEKSISNLLLSIEHSKKCSLEQFIMGLEIPYVGTETSEVLAEIAQDVSHLTQMKKEEFLQIEGIGEKIADALVEFFSDPQHQEEIHLLLSRGVSPQVKEKKQILHHFFSGKTFVLTGTLPHYTRTEASALIKERGGKTTESVSRQTDFVLAGELPGSKLEKAKALHITILNEEDFTHML